MNKKSLIVLLIGFMFLVSALSFINPATAPRATVADACWISPTNSCPSTNSILELYSTTNSHAAISGLEDSYSICCNFYGEQRCGGSNEILALSSLSNAHAELPGLNDRTSNYNALVCYGDLKCIGGKDLSNSQKNKFPIKMVSLSSETNAHVAHYTNSDYEYKVRCKRTGSALPPVGINLLSVSFISFPGASSSNLLQLNQNQIGTESSKVKIKISNINANPDTVAYLEVYERDFIPKPKPKTSKSKERSSTTTEKTTTEKTTTSTEKSTAKTKKINLLNDFILALTGNAVNKPGTQFIYTYTAIRAGQQNKILGTIENGEIYFEWDMNQTDIDKAGINEKQYEFYFNVTIEKDYRRFDNSLRVKIDKDNNIQNQGKKWLDANGRPITRASMNWEDLTTGSSVELPGNENSANSIVETYGSRFHITARAVDADLSDTGSGDTDSGDSDSDDTGSNDETTGTITLRDNLVQMNASGLPLAYGEKVYFDIYEKDSHEGGSNDNIIIDSSISAYVDGGGNAVASWTVTQKDINNALTEDLIVNNLAEYEFYFEVRTNKDIVYNPLGDGVLKLSIVYSDQATSCGNGLCEPRLGENPTTCPEDCSFSGCGNGVCEPLLGETYETCPIDCEDVGSLSYLSGAQGTWTDKEFIDILEEYTFVEGEDNTIGMLVRDVKEGPTQADVYFEIWEKDEAVSSNNLGDGVNTNVPGVDYDDPIIIDDSLFGSIIDDSVSETWTITTTNIEDAGTEDVYEFYFNIKYLDEAKSFRNFPVNITVEKNNGSGWDPPPGDDCEGIDYCSDHESKSMCKDPCDDVLENEMILNPEADCSNANVDCYCAWVNSECIFGYSDLSTLVGLCQYSQENINEDCGSSGYITSSYTATWSWENNNCYDSLEECLLTIENGLEQSCSQADGCWRKIDSTYLNCEDYEDVTACTPGGGEGIGSSIGYDDGFNWWWIVLIIFGILIILALIFFFLARKKTKEKREKELFKTKQNLQNIMGYISKEKRAGKTNYEIKNQLLKAGWTGVQIDYALKKVSGHIKKPKTKVNSQLRK